MARLDETYVLNAVNIFAGPFPEPHIKTVKLAADQGILDMCTLIAADKNNENGKPIGADLNATSGEVGAYFVLSDPVDTDGGERYGNAWVTGNFIKDILITAEGYELTEADLQAMRKDGILVEGARKYDEWKEED